jgi:hypothetical protein
MAVKKPLVISNGQIEQLQAGDVIDLKNTVNRTNANVAAMIVGEVVYASNATSVDKAQADAQSTVRVMGLIVTGGAAAAQVDVQTEGIVTLTTGEWDAVAGTTGGLTAGATYFLSAATAGALTGTAPTAGGEFVVRVGHALSTTELEIDIQQPIKL